MAKYRALAGSQVTHAGVATALHGFCSAPRFRSGRLEMMAGAVLQLRVHRLGVSHVHGKVPQGTVQLNMRMVVLVTSRSSEEAARPLFFKPLDTNCVHAVNKSELMAAMLPTG